MAKSYVVLRDVNDADGSRLLTAELNSGGELVIEGRDFGAGVKRIFGENEYEWAWTVPAAGVEALAQALQAPGEVLAALKDRFSGENAAGLAEFLDAHGIETKRWSRVGD